MRALRLVAISITLAGALVLASTTAGFGFVATERTVNVAVAADQHAVLGLTDRSATGEITGPGDTATVYEVTDNGAGFRADTLDVRIASVEHRDGSRDGNPPLSASVRGTGAYEAEVACTGSSPSLNGEYRVTLRFETTGTVGVDATRTTDAYVPISCTNDDVTVGDGESSDSIDTEGDVSIGNDAEVDGDVDSGGTVTTGDRAELDGDVTADEGVEAGNDVEFGGDVDSGGSVSTGDRTEIDGDLDSGGSVSVGADSEVDGDIDSDGSVSIGDRTEVGGSIDSGGSVTVGADSEVGDDITADGDVTLTDRATVDGDVTADGTVYLGCEVEVDGSIDAENVVETC